jgi:hypothetical protein
MTIKTLAYRCAVVGACVVLYLASIPVTLIGIYNVKTALNINAMDEGGWHHFNQCLTEEMALEQKNMLEGHYGVLAPLAPLLISWGLLPQPEVGPAQPVGAHFPQH